MAGNCAAYESWRASPGPFPNSELQPSRLNDELDDSEQRSPSPAGSGSNLARLFEEHNAALIALLRARLRSNQEARDVAQEAYVRLLQLDQLGTVSYLRTYLFRTALNIATDRLRSASVRVAAHRDPVFDPRVNEISPDRSALAADELRVIAAALESLPAKPRYAFLLHRFADLDIDEVARRLGVTERMVRNYIVQGMLCCRAALDQARKQQDETGGSSS
jgi:RNA polymerase sigma factor (sigma-70 family)